MDCNQPAGTAFGFHAQGTEARDEEANREHDDPNRVIQPNQLCYATYAPKGAEPG